MSVAGSLVQYLLRFLVGLISEYMIFIGKHEGWQMSILGLTFILLVLAYDYSLHIEGSKEVSRRVLALLLGFATLALWHLYFSIAFID